ncbi:alpha-tocopherol transfer protein-like [Ixodes scapularis]|uniref:alpha-tocopherol transfer protein-like n=1 Tax=Ixodes scapularis TaxID=6945 RepID=UPI001A9F57F6|nr:alpha-tocopherol transfer protein-like [Ixodes scapularis]
MDRLSPDLKLLARRELGETPQVSREAVIQLRTLITEEPSLQCPLDEEFLVKFLRGRKYRVVDTLEVIRKYFQVRLEYTDIFDNLLPSRIMFDTIYRRHRVVAVLKEPDSLGRLIVVARLGVWNPSLCSMTELFRAIVLVAEYSLLDPKTQITGIVAVVDLEGLHFTHMLHYTVSEIKKAIKLTQECYPVRIRGIYIINNPPVFELFQPALKLFMKPKLFEKIHFIGRDYDQLYQLVPRERLPEEYGGTMAKFDYDEFEKTLSSAENFFLELGQYGYCKDKASKHSSGPE